MTPRRTSWTCTSAICVASSADPRTPPRSSRCAPSGTGSAARVDAMRALMSRLAPTTLRWRLAGWVAVVTLVCTGIAFAAVYRGTGTQLRNQVDHELGVYAGELAHDLARSDAATPKLLGAAAKRYVL